MSLLPMVWYLLRQEQEQETSLSIYSQKTISFSCTFSLSNPEENTWGTNWFKNHTFYSTVISIKNKGIIKFPPMYSGCCNYGETFSVVSVKYPKWPRDPSSRFWLQDPWHRCFSGAQSTLKMDQKGVIDSLNCPPGLNILVSTISVVCI